ncbi:MAG: gamma-glutamyltransferase, partial [Alphaproteobacteria bacterium]
MRDFQSAGRSTLHAQNGMAACSHPLASLTAIDILRSGGNAIDAAIAASAVLCVVEPMMTGIGGDCFALIAKKGVLPVLGLNGSGRAPAGANAAALRAEGLDEIPAHSAHAVTIPGALAGWQKMLSAHGTMALGDVLQPAIKLAYDGYVVSPRIGTDWLFLVGQLENDPGAKAHFTCNGEAPAIGSLFKTPALGRTLETIADKGIAGFYEGAVAADMLAVLHKNGGTHTADDFASAQEGADWVTPLETVYRGHTLYEIPPNGQGIAAQIILNILENFSFDPAEAESTKRYHLALEAQRIGYQMRDHHVADMGATNVPVDALLHKGQAKQWADMIDPDATNPAFGTLPPLPPRDTIYLSVVDKDRNMVSFINSLYMGFGSGLCGMESGVMLQNRGACFSLEENHPNELAPGKRPMHTIIPAMLAQNGKPWLSFGVMGGAYQPMGHAHVVQNLVDFGLDLQEAIDLPRVMAEGDQIQVETSMSAALIAALSEKGHNPVDAWIPHGGAQAVGIDPAHGTLIGAS